MTQSVTDDDVFDFNNMFDDSESLRGTIVKVSFEISSQIVDHFLKYKEQFCMPIPRCQDQSCPRPKEAQPTLELINDNRQLQISLASRPVSADVATKGGDLTGFGLFIETTLLCKFLIKYRDEVVVGKTMVEVGAGLALPSHVALACGAAHPVTVTDGCFDVIQHLHHPLLRPKKLQWSMTAGADETTSTAIIGQQQQFDVVFGSGIAYSLQTLELLLATVTRLLSGTSSSSSRLFICGFKSRQVNLEKLLEACAKFKFELWKSEIENEQEQLGVFAFKLMVN